MLGMGPVAAPHESVGRVGVQQQPGGFTAGPRTVRRRPVAIGRRQLDPDLAAVGLAQQIGEAGVGDARAGSGRPKWSMTTRQPAASRAGMIAGRRLACRCTSTCQPSVLTCASNSCQAGWSSAGRGRPIRLSRMPATPARPAPADPPPRCRATPRRPAHRRRRRAAPRPDGCCRAQEAGLHQHAARHAVRVQQSQVLRQRRVVVRRVPARVGQRQSLAKDVRVSVDGGALQAGLQRGGAGLGRAPVFRMAEF